MPYVIIGFYTTIIDINKFIAVQKAFAFLAIMQYFLGFYLFCFVAMAM